MARHRLGTFDGDYMLEPLSEVTMDGFLSSSFPGAAPPPKRPQPPRAPLRKPSDVSWDVPPLALPEAPKKGKLPHGSFASGTTLDEECQPLDEKSDDSGEEDEPAIFALDGGGGDDDDEGDNIFQLAGFDDDDDNVVGAGRGYPEKEASPAAPSDTSPTALSGRVRAQSMQQSLGASPILLSVLEQVAASQGLDLDAAAGSFRRFDTC